MAQSAERHLPGEEAHLAAATNIVAGKRTYQRSGFAREAEIKGFLCRYATAGSSYLRQAYGIGKSQRLATDRGNFMKRIVKDEVETTPNVLEVFIEARQTMLLAEHEAGKDPYGSSAGTGIVLQGVEAVTSAQIRLKRTSETYKTLTRVVVNAEGRTEPILRPDDISQLVVSTEGPNLIFAIPNNHLDKEKVVLGDTDGHLELDPVSEKLDGGDEDTPPELGVPFPSSDPATTEPNGRPIRNLIRGVQQSIIRAAGVRFENQDQQPSSYWLSTGGHILCEGESRRYGQSRAVCSMQGRTCYSYGVRGHFGRGCNAGSGNLKVYEDPLRQTGDGTPADYEALKMMNHRTATPGITCAGALDQGRIGNTPRYTTDRAWSVTRRKKGNHLRKPRQERVKLVALRRSWPLRRGHTWQLYKSLPGWRQIGNEQLAISQNYWLP